MTTRHSRLDANGTRPTGRWRGFAATVTLAATLVGVPLLLARMAPHPFPHTINWRHVAVHIRAGYLDDRTIVNTVALIGWVLWTLFTVNVAVEITRGATAIRRRRWSPFAGLSRAWVQTAVLLFAATIATTTPALSALGHHQPVAAAAPPPPPTRAPVTAVSVGAVDVPAGERYTVNDGDSLRSLAEHYYGTGDRWRRIRDASVGVRQPDGTTPSAGFTAITPGMTLRIPTNPPATADLVDRGGERVVVAGDDLTAIVEAAYHPTSAPERDRLIRVVFDANLGVSDGHGHNLRDPNLVNPGMHLRLPAVADGQQPAGGVDGEWVVRRGDTLSSIAGTVYGDTDTWATIWAANPTITNPDRIYPGQHLNVPATERTQNTDTDADAASSDETVAPTIDPAPPPATPGPFPAPTMADTDSSTTTGSLPSPTTATAAAVSIRADPAPSTTTSSPRLPSVTTTPSTTGSNSAAAKGAPVDSRRAEHTQGPRLLGIAGGLLAFGVGVEVARRRRRAWHRHHPHQQPAPVPDELRAVNRAVHVTEPDDAASMVDELAHLVDCLDRRARDTTVVQLVHHRRDGGLDIAIAAAAAPPKGSGWEPAAGRVWHLATRHDPDVLARYRDRTPVLPALVTLGDTGDDGALRFNLDAASGINLTGDPAMIDAYLTSLVWEQATGIHSEHPTIILAGITIPGADALDHITTATPAEALETARIHGTTIAGRLHGRGLPSVRGGAWEPWAPLVVVVPGDHLEPVDDWRTVARLPGVNIVVAGGGLADGLDLQFADTTITIAAWHLTCAAQQLAARAAEQLADLLHRATAAPCPDPTIPAIRSTSEPGEGADAGTDRAAVDTDDRLDTGPVFDHSANGDKNVDGTYRAPDVGADDRQRDAAVSAVNGHHLDHTGHQSTIVATTAACATAAHEETSATEAPASGAAPDAAVWEAPSWPITVHVLGALHVTGPDATDVALTPQQLAAVTYLAVHRDVTVREFCEAIWDQDPETLGRTPRDLLYRLRSTLGGSDIIGEIDGAHIHAGPGLGCDLDVVHALLARARNHENETIERLQQALDVATGRPFLLPSRGRGRSWHWVSEQLLENTWCGRLSTIAYELANHHLTTGHAATALTIAEHALRLIPGDQPSLELLLTATAVVHGPASAEALLDRQPASLFDDDDDDSALLDKALHRAKAVAGQLHDHRSADDTPAGTAAPR